MLPGDYKSIMNCEFDHFIDTILGSLREEQYSLMTTPIIFVGGGAILMNNYCDRNYGHFTYLTDVKANAIGYETLARIALSKGG